MNEQEPKYFTKFIDEFKDFKKSTVEQFNKINEKLDKHTKQFEGVEIKLIEVDKKLSKHSKLISDIQVKLVKIDEKLDSYEEQIASVSEQITIVEDLVRSDISRSSLALKNSSSHY